MSDFSRRTLIRGAAWTTPVILAVGAAPAFATSLRKDPGINGWVQVNYSTRYGFDAQFNSNINGNGPDGAPFGLYLYDVNLGPGNTILDTVTNASITLWFRGGVSSWSRNGTSSRWSNATSVVAQTKPDDLSYRGYRFDYNGSVPGSGFVVGSDGRLYLDDFNFTANNVDSGDATFWVERRITVNSVAQTFQRRNGERGSMGNGFPSGISSRRAVETAGVPI